MSRIRHWLWLATREEAPCRNAVRLWRQMGNPEAVYHGDPSVYDRMDLSSKVKERFLDKDLGGVDEILRRCEELGIRVITIQDAEYPDRLRQLEHPPFVLYVKGTFPQVDQEVAITLVGTREATPYGVQAARKLGLDLARCGALVVSGSARGVDTAALKGAIQGGGKVISVLGNGIDVVYPRENQDLYDDVARVGALVSEYPPGTEPLGRHFPVRNRILSGLSLGTVVVEGDSRSGSLITARHALDQDREVFAIPGNIDAPMSQGPNALIRRGEAKLVQNVWHILEEYEYIYPTKLRPVKDLPPEAEEGRLSAAQSPSPPSGPAAEEDFWEKTPQREEVKKPPKRKDPEWTQEEGPPAEEPPPKVVVDLGQNPEFFTDDEAALLRALQGDKELTADDLVEATGIPARRVLSAMTLLQVRQLADQSPGKRFVSRVILKE